MDRYTKAVLTIIATALVWIGSKDTGIISDAMASSGVIEVKVVSMNLPSHQPVPVKVEGKISCNNN